MARRKRAGRPSVTSSKTLYQLESQLMLLGWANQKFGFRTNQMLFDVMKSASEGYDAGGRSHVARMLGARDYCLIPPGDLARYDDNVQRHLRSINERRRDPIILRYFQQLGALYAELFLDRLATDPVRLASEIHSYVRQRVHSLPSNYPVRRIETDDLNKLAFWMATGSGKTLIMHLNYLQYLHYFGSARLENIILVTPNEGLSAQHMEELTASGIPSARFGDVGLLAGHPKTVWVTEITKLVEKRRGRTGVSIEVDALGDRNLVFVDEGHRGASGEVWHSVRNAIADRGFTFEYSATFGQALAVARDNKLTLDYGKSIVFDYSYRYFHRDGFGKDFRVLNVAGSDPPPALTNLLLLGNLLSFYEQLCTYRDNASDMRAYNLEKPLWIFVGGSVNAVYKRRGRETSDVLAIQLFLHRVLSDSRWAKDAIGKLLRGKSGLHSAWNVDLFDGRFNDLAQSQGTSEEIYADMLRSVFHTSGPAGLRLCDILGAPGELGLKAVGADHYFGLTYIGDTAKFKKLAQKAGGGIILEQDAVGGTIFDGINEKGATVNVLIGAKKFVEGWNSWRVSSMGLMNVGRAKGSEIIQLFGRGVRLKGKGMSLKRSTYLEGQHPANIGLLETLNIFSVRADYMTKFREYLETEGLETRDPVSLRVPVRTNEKFLDRGLKVPALPDGVDFESQSNFALDTEQLAPILIDRVTRASAWEVSASGQQISEGTAGFERDVSDLPLRLVDWEEAYLDLMLYRRIKGMHALAIPRPSTLKSLVEKAPVRVLADQHVFTPRNWRDREDLQAIVRTMLRCCADKCWKRARSRWESVRMRYRVVDDSDLNLLHNVSRGAASKPSALHQSHYAVSAPREQANLFSQIVDLIEQQEKLYEQENGSLRRIYFDRHLYQPLLIQSSNPAVTVSPLPLNESEAGFVRHLRDFWQQRGSTLYPDTELFLLRNQGRGRGVGFSLEGTGFYPDFILWMITGDRQRVIFVEPHGMVHAKAYEEDEKARLHEQLPILAEGIASRSNVAGVVSLDSFIVSATEYRELRLRYGALWSKEEFAERHILFPDENGDYIEKLLAPA